MYENTPTRALPRSTSLHDTYHIERILGEGGFAITYIGRHLSTGQTVAIKEYFPSKLAARMGDNTLHPFGGQDKELFLKGRRHFYREANMLKEFQHIDSVVSVYEVLEENNTVYIVMEYIEGPTLEQYVHENGPMHFAELMPLITPIIHAMSIIHEQKQIHRDISPDNLILGVDNCLHLIDFGAASPEDISGRHNTVILKSGYAPPEQYIANSKIGAWVDIYALCATMCFALTGNPPVDALRRTDEDSLSPLAALTDILPWQRAALEKGLDLQPAKRFHDVRELYYALTVAPEQSEMATIMDYTLGQTERQNIRRFQIRRHLPKILFAAVLLLVLTGGVLIRYAIRSVQTVNNETVSAGSPTASAVSAPTATSPATPSATTDGTATSNHADALPMPSAALGGTANNDQADAPSTLLTMPNVSGIPLKQAKKVLQNLDSSIQIRTTRIYDAKVKKGWVISQSVAEGSVFSEGHLSTILLTVSLGKEQPSDAKPASSSNPTPKATKKSPSSDYKVTPDEEDYITVPLE